MLILMLALSLVLIKKKRKLITQPKLKEADRIPMAATLLN